MCGDAGCIEMVWTIDGCKVESTGQGVKDLSVALQMDSDWKLQQCHSSWASIR
jgi:hypothetical protein